MSDCDSQEDYYFRIDERQNTLDSLQKTREFLSRVDKDEFYWKWAMISLHNALYGSMILVLQGTNPVRVEDKGRAENIKRLKRKNPTLEIDVDEHHIISFFKAFEMIQMSEFMEMYVDSKFVCITPEAEKFDQKSKYTKKVALFPPRLNTSLEHLNNYIRNQFLHYYPISISYGKGGFVQIIEDVIELMEFLLLKSGNFRIDNDEEWRSIKTEIASILDLVGMLRVKYLPK